MKLDLRSLIAGEMRSMPVDFELTLLAEENDVSSPLYMVSFPSPVMVKGKITNTAGYMQMTLSVSTSYVAECARCLDEVHGDFSFPVERIVATPDMLVNVSEDRMEDYVITSNGFLSLDDLLLELFTLHFPSKILCHDDCLGLCPSCGKRKTEEECSCTVKEIDPRMEPFRKILAEMQEDNTNS